MSKSYRNIVKCCQDGIAHVLIVKVELRTSGSQWYAATTLSKLHLHLQGVECKLQEYTEEGISHSKADVRWCNGFQIRPESLQVMGDSSERNWCVGSRGYSL